MFGLFKKKTEKEKLTAKYKKLMAEAHQLSQRDRKAGDAKLAEANAILEKIEVLN